jgi:hypothetical protein
VLSYVLEINILQIGLIISVFKLLMVFAYSGVPFYYFIQILKFIDEAYLFL